MKQTSMKKLATLGGARRSFRHHPFLQILFSSSSLLKASSTFSSLSLCYCCFLFIVLAMRQTVFLFLQHMYPINCSTTCWISLFLFVLGYHDGEDVVVAVDDDDNEVVVTVVDISWPVSSS